MKSIPVDSYCAVQHRVRTVAMIHQLLMHLHHRGRRSPILHAKPPQKPGRRNAQAI